VTRPPSSAPLPSADHSSPAERARRVRRRYPIIDRLDATGMPAPDITGLALLPPELEAPRRTLERRLRAHVVVYADFGCLSLPSQLQLCRRTTPAALTADEVRVLRDFERSLPAGHAACAYTDPGAPALAGP
jgi:hypothetical protein